MLVSHNADHPSENALVVRTHDFTECRLISRLRTSQALRFGRVGYSFDWIGFNHGAKIRTSA